MAVVGNPPLQRYTSTHPRLRRKNQVPTLETKYKLIVLKMHHERLWCFMSTHDASSLLLTPHEYLWWLRGIHGASDLSSNGKPWKLRGFQPDRYRWVSGACLCIFRDFQFSMLYLFGVVPFLMLFWEHLGGPREQPGTTKHRFGGSCGLRGPFWRNSVTKRLFKKYQTHEQSPF